MGQVPPGFRPHPAPADVRQRHHADRGLEDGAERRRLLLGRAAGQPRQLLAANTGADGTAAGVTSDPSALPSNCGASTGSPAYSGKAPVLLSCFAQWEFRAKALEVARMRLV